MFGLICNDEIAVAGHCLFLNFRQALYNTFNKNSFKDIKSVSELDNITHLFIIDEHFPPNVDIWKKQEIVDKANERNIKVIVFNFEKIFNTVFPWNVDHQRFLEQFKNLIQPLTDIDDIKNIKTPFINKQLLSKDTYVTKRNITKITDRVLFVGQTEGDCYAKRRETLNTVSQILPLEILSNRRCFTYDEYLDTVSRYKFVLNPLGVGSFLNLRYYEIIQLGSIPVQQVVPEMMTAYSELNSNYSINFLSPEDLKNIDLNAFKQNTSQLFLEDYFKEVDLPSFI